MTGLVRKATLFCACGLLVGGVAMAGVPDPTTSAIGLSINLGGYVVGGASVTGVTKTMLIRDAFSNPVQNSTVVIDFSACANSLGGPSNDIRLCSSQPHHPVFNCAQRTVTAVTNASGIATFQIAGHSINGSGPQQPGYAGLPPSTNACGVVFADAVPMGRLVVGGPDEDNTGGVNPGDYSRFLIDRFAVQPANYRARSDFDGNGVVNPADFSIMLSIRFSAGTQQSCSNTGGVCL